MSRLRRYTQLPYLLHMLTTRSITLVNPTTWDDRNDSYYLSLYCKRKSLKSALVMCLSKSASTYHHWHVFADTASGVCIEFHESAFRKWVEGIPNARIDRVRYFRLDEIDKQDLDTETLPFVKRKAYRDEGEMRVVVDAKEDLKMKAFPFELSMIKEVVLSPWLPIPVQKSVESTLGLICSNHMSVGSPPFVVRPTTLLENERFKNAAGT